MADNNHHQNSLLKVIDNCEWMCPSKDSTRQQTYDEILKEKTILKKKNQQLKQQLQKTKQVILKKALGIYLQELSQLNKQNEQIRAEYRIIYEARKKPLNIITSSYVNQLPQTPRSRKKMNNATYGNSKVESSKVSESEDYSGKKSLINQQNIKVSQMYGRRSLKTPRGIKNNTTQMTERKSYGNIKYSGISSSLFEERKSMRNSMRPSLQKMTTIYESQKLQKNVFLNMVNLILQEEKIKEQEYKEFLSDERNQYYQCEKSYKQERFYINELEKEVSESQQNIQKIEEALKTYTKDILQMGVEIEQVTKMTQELFTLKGQFIKMQKKCDNVKELRRSVSIKEEKLLKLKESLGPNHHKFKINPPQSIKMVLRVFGIEEDKVHDAKKCKLELKKIGAEKLDKPGKKKLKIRELLDTIRQGRKKFTEIMTIYTSRIEKMESKINNFRENKKLRKGIDH